MRAPLRNTLKQAISFLSQTLIRWWNQEEQTDVACGTRSGKKWNQGFGGNTWREENNRKTYA